MSETPIDDARIDRIAREVLTGLRKDRARAAHPPSGTATPPPGSDEHPAESLLSIEGGVRGQPCVLDAGQVCVLSRRCRTFGY